MDQTPAAGQLVDEGSTVTLFVSNGRLSEVPDVVGQDQGEAEADLRSAGFRASVRTTPVDEPDEDGRVLSQTPAGGKERRSGATVVITVGTFTAPHHAGAGTQAPVRVALLAGGRSSEHDVSLASARSVLEASRRAATNAAPIVIDRDGVWRAARPAPGHRGARRRRRRGEAVALQPGTGLLDADVVFPVLHGPFGEDGTVQGLLECVGRSLRGRRSAGLRALHGQGWRSSG